MYKIEWKESAIKDLQKFEGQEVEINGWVANFRSVG